MNTKEIETAIGATEAQVSKATEGMGDINPSMLATVSEKVHGGKIAVSTQPTAIEKTVKAPVKARRTAAMKRADEALTVQRDQESLAISQNITAATQPQVLQSIDENAPGLSIVDEVAAKLGSEIASDIQAIGQMMTPELRALKTVQSGQILAGRLSAKMQAEGLTVEAIIDAAIPAQTQRRSMDDLFKVELDAIAATY